MKDIEPNPNLNKVAAGLIGMLALFFFYLAHDTYQLIRSDEWIFVAVLAGIGGILLLWALRLWRIPPVNTARLRFRSGGFRLEIKQVFRRNKDIDLDWADIRAITLENGGLYGGRCIRISHGHDKDVASFSPSWTRCSSREVIDRLMASAGTSGYQMEKVTGGWRSFVQDQWRLTKIA